FPGDYIRPPTSGQNIPLLTVERTDKMRVVVQAPDLDVPYIKVGQPATVDLDALPESTFQAEVSRVSDVEDLQPRLMHVEIDLLTPNGKIHQGMYGNVSIVLENSATVLSLPSSCLVGKAQGGRGTVFVVRDGSAVQVHVRIGSDNGLRVTILS